MTRIFSGRRKAFMAMSLGVAYALGLSIAGARASESAAYSACMAKSVSTRDMQACQQAAVAAANRRLRAALDAAMHTLPADQQAKLRLAQQRWTAFRHSDCAVFYGNDTGTLATIRGGQCFLDRTDERIEQLRDFARPEGN